MADTGLAVRRGFDPDTKPGCIQLALLLASAACLIGRWLR